VALDTSYTGAVSSDGYSIAQYKVSKYSASGGCLWNVYPHWSSSYYLGDGLQIAVAAGKLYVVGPGGGSAVVDVWNADTGAALDEEVIASDGWWTSMAANDSGQVAIATSTFLVPYQWTAP
jgi:hypothetical protein